MHTPQQGFPCRIHEGSVSQIDDDRLWRGHCALEAPLQLLHPGTTEFPLELPGNGAGIIRDCDAQHVISLVTRPQGHFWNQCAENPESSPKLLTPERLCGIQY